MKKLWWMYVSLALLVVCTYSMSVYAATNAPTPKADLNTVDALPWYQALEPYLQALFQAIVAAALAAGAALFYRFTGIKVEEKDLLSIQNATSNAAGRILAQIEGPVSNIRFNLGSSAYAPLIKQEVDHIRETLPKEMERRDMSPEHLEKMVLGQLGKLQQGTATPTTTTGRVIP